MHTSSEIHASSMNHDSTDETCGIKRTKSSVRDPQNRVPDSYFLHYNLQTEKFGLQAIICCLTVEHNIQTRPFLKGMMC